MELSYEEPGAAKDDGTVVVSQGLKVLQLWDIEGNESENPVPIVMYDKAFGNLSLISMARSRPQRREDKGNYAGVF